MSLRKWLKMAALRPLDGGAAAVRPPAVQVQKAQQQRRHKYDFTRPEKPITKEQQAWILAQQQKLAEAGVRAPAIRDADLTPEQLAELNALRGEMDAHDVEYAEDE
jgi:hypothetical protein